MQRIKGCKIMLGLQGSSSFCYNETFYEKCDILIKFLQIKLHGTETLSIE